MRRFRFAALRQKQAIRRGSSASILRDSWRALRRDEDRGCPVYTGTSGAASPSRRFGWRIAGNDEEKPLPGFGSLSEWRYASQTALQEVSSSPPHFLVQNGLTTTRTTIATIATAGNSLTARKTRAVYGY